MYKYFVYVNLNTSHITSRFFCFPKINVLKDLVQMNLNQTILQVNKSYA